MDLGLKGKRALIVGGSKGIGLSTAVQLAREGTRTVLLARNEQVLKAAVTRIHEEKDAETWALAADLKRPGEAEAGVQRAREMLGGLDIVVNCAGGAPLGSAVEARDEDWRDGIETKLMGCVRICRAAVPVIRAGGSGGAIINLAGSWGREPDPNAAVASTVNAALAAFSKSLAKLLARDRIRVFCVNPTATRTDLWFDLARRFGSRFGKSGEEVSHGVAATIPIGRIAEPEEVAKVVAFLASDAASYLTGLAVDVDGGKHAGVF